MKSCEIFFFSVFYLWIQRTVSVYLFVSVNYYANGEHYLNKKENQILTKIEIQNNSKWCWNVCKGKKMKNVVTIIIKLRGKNKTHCLVASE